MRTFAGLILAKNKNFSVPR